MTTSDYGDARRGGGLAWLYAPVVLILFLGGALSAGAYFYSDTPLTVMESIAAGFGGLAGLILGLIGAAFGIVVGLIGALVGLVLVLILRFRPDGIFPERPEVFRLANNGSKVRDAQRS